jgi:hypothetical protein
MLLPPFKIYEAMRSLACEQQKRLDPARVEARKTNAGAFRFVVLSPRRALLSSIDFVQRRPVVYGDSLQIIADSG